MSPCLQKVDTVTISDKTKRVLIANIFFIAKFAGFGPVACCLTKISRKHAPLSVGFQSSRSFKYQGELGSSRFSEDVIRDVL